MRWIAFGLLLAGCSAHTHVSINSGSPSSGVFVRAEGGNTLAAFVGLSVLFGALYASEGSAGLVTTSPKDVPELDSSRKVSEQDCSKPIDFTRGNIRCK